MIADYTTVPSILIVIPISAAIFLSWRLWIYLQHRKWDKEVDSAIAKARKKRWEEYEPRVMTTQEAQKLTAQAIEACFKINNDWIAMRVQNEKLQKRIEHLEFELRTKESPYKTDLGPLEG